MSKSEERKTGSRKGRKERQGGEAGKPASLKSLATLARASFAGTIFDLTRPRASRPIAMDCINQFIRRLPKGLAATSVVGTYDMNTALHTAARIAHLHEGVHAFSRTAGGAVRITRRGDGALDREPFRQGELRILAR